MAGTKTPKAKITWQDFDQLLKLCKSSDMTVKENEIYEYLFAYTAAMRSYQQFPSPALLSLYLATFVLSSKASNTNKRISK